MCIAGKSENKFIQEFLTHYKNLGVDKMFLYDNYQQDWERFIDVIKIDVESRKSGL